ncbi:hypothetical protein ADIS_0177 [Lunatimonas lonarensis]|uniref:Uncharacterized protein n=1 Tax=Lunatimonas lonarensis TaxID=1232681 RepID=R7ZZ59_9BACT|nr:hypothetical protein ADIS_0177 [Lunatimonas lonarensis]
MTKVIPSIKHFKPIGIPMLQKHEGDFLRAFLGLIQLQ